MQKRPSILLAAAVAGLFTGCTTPAENAAFAPRCSLSADDQRWLTESVSAWREASGRFLPESPSFTAIVFSADCVLTSDTVFSTGENVWETVPYSGELLTPWGAPMPLAPVSYATPHDGRPYYLMSAPSVWRAADVPAGPLGLETLMRAVLLHEAAHAAQNYFTRLDAISVAHNLPDDFDDDSIQAQFEDNDEFAESVKKETDLLFAAALAQDDGDAIRLAREARDLMRARRARWYVGDDAYLAEIEDIFWAMEGSGQWIGYQWLISDWGAGLDTGLVMDAFAKRGRWWSQTQGLALVLAADRIGAGAWRGDAFGSAERGALQYLEDAVESHSRT